MGVLKKGSNTTQPVITQFNLFINPFLTLIRRHGIMKWNELKRFCQHCCRKKATIPPKSRINISLFHGLPPVVIIVEAIQASFVHS